MWYNYTTRGNFWGGRGEASRCAEAVNAGASAPPRRTQKEVAGELRSRLAFGHEIELEGGTPVTGHGHRIVNFTLVGAVTCSLPAALCALLGAAFPDSSEWLLWGRNRNRWHRRLTHWFVPWLALSLLCLSRAGWRTPTLAGLTEGESGDLWACAGFWLAGGLLHIAMDACCGKVPFLLPWRRTFGAHLFRTSPRPGELSPGEMAVTFFLSATALGAWAARSGLL